MAKRSYFSELEKTILTELVDKNISVVESKKTDFRSIRRKSEIWTKIRDEFNAQMGVQQRTDKQLKKCWENQKSRAKQDLCKERRERLQTGGGQISTIADEESQKVCAMVASQTAPLKNLFDDDNCTDDCETDENGENQTMMAEEKRFHDTDKPSTSKPLIEKPSSSEKVRQSGMTVAQKLVISRQEAEHKLRMELLQTQLDNAIEEHKLTMEILHLKKRKLETGEKNNETHEQCKSVSFAMDSILDK